MFDSRSENEPVLCQPAELLAPYVLETRDCFFEKQDSGVGHVYESDSSARGFEGVASRESQGGVGLRAPITELAWKVPKRSSIGVAESQIGDVMQGRNRRGCGPGNGVAQMQLAMAYGRSLHRIALAPLGTSFHTRGEHHKLLVPRQLAVLCWVNDAMAAESSAALAFPQQLPRF